MDSTTLQISLAIQIGRREHVEITKNVTKKWQDKVKISDGYVKLCTKFSLDPNCTSWRRIKPPKCLSRKALYWLKQCGIACSLLTKEELHAPSQCRLQKPQWGSWAHFLSHSAYDRVPRLDGRCHDFLDVGRDQQLLASQSCRRR